MFAGQCKLVQFSSGTPCHSMLSVALRDSTALAKLSSQEKPCLFPGKSSLGKKIWPATSRGCCRWVKILLIASSTFEAVLCQ